MSLVKICGVTSPEIAIAAAGAGADLIGFVFFPKSPRFIEVEAAEAIVSEVKWASQDRGFEVPGFVGLFVDPSEKALSEPAAFLSRYQLHGREDAARIAEIRAAFGLEVMKAVGLGAPSDLEAIGEIAEAADMLLFDAKPPKGADRPGGHGAAFDWAMLEGYRSPTPFLLAGGLDAGNIGAAIAAVRGIAAFEGVDVSSGVEAAPGRKDAAKVAGFIKAARIAFTS